ncbi:hypothetical protein [Endozoicomonas sp. YOMI1]|uniref:hypothetical protein n=1 Tax=Endozoicomonas sp. YOMI1 TaxID=2828739 RepID=UPI0021493F8D|nr:hypothetical protein [Endozoicomonas sp. YOMI1]
MKPDLSLSNTDATWYLFQKYGEQTTSPVLPRVNIDSSDLTRAPQSIGLQRRSGIEVHTQSCLPSLRSLLPKSFRLHLDLRENDRQIDTHRNDFKS